jgi:hypothetical protein
MARYYDTTSAEDPAVFHNNKDCEEGGIEARNRVDTDTIPAGRRLCEVC